MFAECYKPGDPVGSAEANGKFCKWDALCGCVSRNVENKIAWVSDNVRGVSLCAVELSDISYIRMIETHRYTSAQTPRVLEPRREDQNRCVCIVTLYLFFQ